MASYSFFLLALAAFFSCVVATQVQKCGSGPSPITVNIRGCTKEPCPLVDGTDAIMDVTFKVPKNSATLKPKVRATVGPLTITYPLPADKQDGCKSLTNGYCPLDAGETIVYKLVMPVSGFPLVSVLLEFSLLGDKDEVFQCFKVDCKVVAGKSESEFAPMILTKE